MEFDFRLLKAFVSVVDCGGFGAAAKVLHLSQAAVSERIARLETLVGLRLLDRNPRQINPTVVGRRFHVLARQMLEHDAAVKLELSELAGAVRGSLQIGASNIPGEYILPPLLPEFCVAHPQVELNLRINDSAEVIELVHQGQVEAGIVGSRPSSRQFTIEPLWQDRLVLVVPAGHPLAGRKRVGAREIAAGPFIMREEGSGTRKLLEAVFATNDIELPPVTATLSSTTAVKEAVCAGLGMTLLSERAVRKEAATGVLALIELRGLRFERHFLLITDRQRTLSPLCQRFAQYLRTAHTANPR
ncbi:MAG: LysR family transcriptional regulator [Gammaproteobacteria bacterium]|nr:LysR family transcriptional regulator [Gammaproteobacteria bacterium]